METADLVVETLLRHRFRYVTEQELQEGIWKVLTGAGLEAQREVQLSGRNRIDFLVGRIGIEVKVDGSLSALIRQAIRYARHEEIDVLVIASTLARHQRMPTELNGKPVLVAYLGRGAF